MMKRYGHIGYILIKIKVEIGSIVKGDFMDTQRSDLGINYIELTCLVIWDILDGSSVFEEKELKPSNE